MTLPSREDISRLIHQELGVWVEDLDHDCAIIGGVSLAPFGVVGSVTVYRGHDGRIHAAPVPFGHHDKCWGEECK